MEQATIQHLDPQNAANNGLLGYFWWLWAMILHTLGGPGMGYETTLAQLAQEGIIILTKPS